uniref:AAR2 protein n=1 Tax=Kalanchoe fedtschenkoi TaxID=63787 RepID=A0A7N0ZQY8_KALFE
MEAETEMEVSEEGATLLLLGVPKYTLFGIDTQIFSVGPEFKGIKSIPPGPHFVYYSSSNRSGSEFSPVVGFFIYTDSSDIIVRQWNAQEERLVRLLEDEEERYRSAVKGFMFDKQLGPYPINQYVEWKRLSSFVTKAVIDRIEPIGGEITVCSENDIYKDIPKTTSEKALTEQLKNSKISSSLDLSGKHRCYYTTIPRLIKRKGVSGQELTDLNHDKTRLLETMLAKEYGGCEELFLGEMQFAFVAFLMGQSLEGFMQWKSIVSLMLSCIEALFRTRSHLFTKFIRVLYHQLHFAMQKDGNNMGEKGASALLDDSWLSSDSFLYHLYKDFFSSVQESASVDGDLLSWTRKLKDLLEDVLGWDFEQKSAIDGIYFNVDDEFAPVVEMVCDDSNGGSSAVDMPQ